MSEHLLAYQTRVEERTAFWQSQADLQMSRRSLHILVASWRAAQPAIEAAGAVLDRRHLAHIQARYPQGPIPVGETSLFRPGHREALDVCTGVDAARVRHGFEDLLSQIGEALTTPSDVQPEGEHNGHPDQPAA